MEITQNISGYSANFIARFTYVANITIITFLNDDLLKYLQNNTHRNKRSADLYISNITDGEKLTLKELMELANCGPYNYTVNNETFKCDSNCIVTSYCKNNGICELINGIISCKCQPFAVYTTSGPQCENLSLNLNAFFGILFGTLAILLLLLLGIWLGIRCYRQRIDDDDDDDDDTDESYQSRFDWKSSLFPSFERLGEILNPDTKVKDSVNWKPQLETVNSSIEIKIKRPEIKSDLNE
ncbi:mucin-4-like [Mixophyes fleayi]|uniref:mucin-4-like n=1 Tax=Mixophyes fleayi TaxID=3061075 RepID=UPI003F4DFCAD